MHQPDFEKLSEPLESTPNDTNSTSFSALNLLHEGKLFAEGVVAGAVLNPINIVIDGYNGLADKHVAPLEFSNQNEVSHSVAGVFGELSGVALDVMAAGEVSAALKLPSLWREVAKSATQIAVFSGTVNTELRHHFHRDPAWPFNGA